MKKSKLETIAKWRRTAIDYQLDVISKKDELIRKYYDRIEHQAEVIERLANLNKRVANRIKFSSACKFFLTVILYKLKLKK